jgi:hypothetical protein
MTGWSFEKRLNIGLLLIAFVVFGMIIINCVNVPLKNTCTVRVKPLEVTPSVAVAKNIVDDWRMKGALAAAQLGTYLDFPFIVVYSITFWFFCVWAGIALGPHDERWPAYGRAFGRAGILAGALDFFVENPGLLLEMSGTYNPWITAIKAIGSWIKWVLVLLIFVFLLSSWIMWLRIWRGKDSQRVLPELL